MEFFNADTPLPVLVVEDDPVTAMVLRRYLEASGYSVAQASDGIEALALHRQYRFRIVVSDWNMPSMDGTTLCKEFRNLGGSYVYFILCSARTDRADRVVAFEAGVDDFLTKPIDQGELAARLVVAGRILASEDGLKRQRKQLEETASRLVESNVELHSLSRKYSDLFQGLPMACFTYDTDGRIREWNREAEAAFGIPAEQASGAPVWEVLQEAHYAVWSEIRSRAFLAGGSEQTFDWCLGKGDGNVRSFAANIICMKDDGGQPLGVVCASIDITDRKQAEAQIADYAMQVSAQKVALEAMNTQLNELAITDELTGLSNRRHFRERLAQALTYSDGQDISLLLLDLDHFKRVNDAKGHLAGDEVLRQFAKLLRHTAMGGEIISRYGGEEFAILVPGADAEHGWLAGERFRRAIEQHSWDGISVTVSVGVATSRTGVTDQDDLVGRADAALYVAKESGRNRVCSADPPLATASIA